MKPKKTGHVVLRIQSFILDGTCITPDGGIHVDSDIYEGETAAGVVAREAGKQLFGGTAAQRAKRKPRKRGPR